MNQLMKCEVFKYLSDNSRNPGYVWQLRIATEKYIFRDCPEVFTKIIHQFGGTEENNSYSLRGFFKSEDDVEGARNVVDGYLGFIEKFTKIYFLEDGVKEKIDDIINPYLVIDRLIE